MMKVLFDPIDDNLPQEISDLNTNLRNWRARPRLEIRGLHESAPAVIDSLPVGEMRAVHEYPHHPEGDESWKDGSTFESPPLLENWLIQTHTYSEKEAAKTSILGGLLSAEGRQVKAGLVHEAKRFSFDKTPSFKRVEVGIAVRLSVATDSFSGKFDLTLPNLAADAQLSRANTRVGITVVGYAGPLGRMLPAPKDLNVESCAEYLKAFRNIQRQIFGKSGFRHVVPTCLSGDTVEPERKEGETRKAND